MDHAENRFLFIRYMMKLSVTLKATKTCTRHVALTYSSTVFKVCGAMKLSPGKYYKVNSSSAVRGPVKIETVFDRRTSSKNARIVAMTHVPSRRIAVICVAKKAAVGSMVIRRFARI